MKITNEISALQTMGSIVGSGGTVTSTGTLITATYEPAVALAVNVGANAAGAVVATLQQSSSLASGYTDLGTISAGTLAAASVLALGSITAPYLRTVVTATGGTDNVATTLLLKSRTITA
ncbi:MAG: hypothetical protein ACKPDI_01700 [Actinomycetota bacterium]